MSDLFRIPEFEPISQFVNTLPLPVWVKDDQHRHVLVNHAFLRFFDLAPDAVLGKATMPLYAGGQTEKILSAERQLLTTGITYETRTLIPAPDGKSQSVLIIKNRFISRPGQIFIVAALFDITGRDSSPGTKVVIASDAIFSYFVDITEQKNLEQYLFNRIIETEEKNRRQFASDLHDDLGPMLSAIKLQLGLLYGSAGEPKRIETLRLCEDLLSEAIGKMRSVANNLMPRLIESYGLETALQSFFQTIQNEKAFVIDFTSNLLDRRLAAEKELHLYRIVSELITNTRKHSAATAALLSLYVTGDHLTVTYSDNGSGYSPIDPVTKMQGMGLQNIIRRVVVIGGTIEFLESDRRTSVVIRLNI